MRRPHPADGPAGFDDSAEPCQNETVLTSANGELTEIERAIAELDRQRAELNGRAQALRAAAQPVAPVHHQSPPHAKVTLFRQLFVGRTDVYAKRFENPKTSRSGYAPACRNEWVKGLCDKPRVACAVCSHKAFPALDDEVIRCHLLGHDPADPRRQDFTIGVYPLAPDDTCVFVAVDFDGGAWAEDACAYFDTCAEYDIPAAIERSRSGNGGHVWIFFETRVDAGAARRLASLVLERAMSKRPELGFASFDRLFPNQDTLPKGGFGNLIALPLQHQPRMRGNSVFVTRDLVEVPDQWAFLSTLRRLGIRDLTSALRVLQEPDNGQLLEPPDERAPWEQPASRTRSLPAVIGPLPDRVQAVLGDQVYLARAGLPNALLHRLQRLAAFANPEFYAAQRMRLSTYGKPRVICCAEHTRDHLALPRGCLDAARALLADHGVTLDLNDVRQAGMPSAFAFHGQLRPEQQTAAHALLEHDTGVLEAATAFGKTVVAANIIARRRTNTLIIVHRKQLVEQWRSALSRFLGLDLAEIGQLGGGKRVLTSTLDVAMAQSLIRNDVVDDMLDQYGQIVVDECHHVSAASVEQILRRAKARYILGLSATIRRKNGHQPIVHMQCGPTRYRTAPNAVPELLERKVFASTTPFVPTPSASSPERGIQELYTELAADNARNLQIVADVRAAMAAGRWPVLLTERREHLAVLVAALQPHVAHIIVYTGGMGHKQRRAAAERLAALGDHTPRLIVATGRFLGEGFDDPRLDTLFLALPIAWRGTLTQYVGRLHRAHPGKTDVRIVDYVDANVGVFRSMFTKRKSGYKALGYRILERSPEFGTGQLALRM